MNVNTNIFERILQIAELKGIKNIPELAIFMGYDSAEKLYRLKRNPNAKPSYDIVEDFTNKFEDLNVRYLITGSGEPFLAHLNGSTPTVISGENHPLGIDYSDTPTTKTKKTTGKTTANTTGNRVLTPQFVSVSPDGNENILYVNAKAAAGYLNGYSDREYIENLPSFNLPGLTQGTFRSFEVSGDSMHPTLENKEMVIGQWVDKLEHIREDRVHIIVTKHEGIVIKRLLNRIDQYGYIIAKSDAIDNRNLYPSLHIYPDDILEVWYGVWHGSFNFKAPAEVYKRVNNLEADIEEIKRRLGMTTLKLD